jgi:hypothetical protein
VLGGGQGLGGSKEVVKAFEAVRRTLQDRRAVRPCVRHAATKYTERQRDEFLAALAEQEGIPMAKLTMVQALNLALEPGDGPTMTT